MALPCVWAEAQHVVRPPSRQTSTQDPLLHANDVPNTSTNRGQRCVAWVILGDFSTETHAMAPRAIRPTRRRYTTSMEDQWRFPP